MAENKSFLNGMSILEFLIAIGLFSAVFILGVQAKQAVVSQQSITVKGLAEKQIKVDYANWTISLSVTDMPQAGAVKKLADERLLLIAFLTEQVLNSSTTQVEAESQAPHYDEIFIKDQLRHVQNSFDAYQNLRIYTKDLYKITQANKNLVQFKTQDRLETAQPPNYLVNNLKAV